jgi:hypothetical protein
MWEEVRHLAAIPIAVATVVAVTLAALVALASPLGEPWHSMLVSGAAAIGAMIGSAMLQAGARADERRRAARVLKANLQILAQNLRSDIRMVLEPFANAEGDLLKGDELPLYAERAVRTAERALSLASPDGHFSDQMNVQIAELRSAVDSFIPLMRAAAQSAATYPATVEQYFQQMGTTTKHLVKAGDFVCTKLSDIIDRL